MSTDSLRPDNRGEASAFLAIRARLGMQMVPIRRIDPAPVGRKPRPKPQQERHEPVVLSWLAPLNMLLPPSWRAIVKLVSLKHGVSVQQVMGMSRTFVVSAARQEAMFLIYTHCEPNFTLIGRLFGNRDHTTARHLVVKEARSRGVNLPIPPTGRPKIPRCHDAD